MSDEDRDEARSMAHDDLIDAMLDGAEYYGPEAYTLTAELRLAEERGYRRAVQALRDEAAASVIFESSRLNDFEASRVAEALADHLESLAAAPRNEGAQT